MEVPVIYEDDDIVVINKPSGVLVHGAKLGVNGLRREEGETIVDWVLKKYPEVGSVGDNSVSRPGIVHRLDRDTSGVLIIARNQESFLYLKSLFQNGGIKKTYTALVRGVPSPRIGSINLPIGLRSGTTKWSTKARNLKMIKPAETSYEVVETFTTSFGEFALVSVMPLTGRTHQIRVHFSATSHPVVCDSLYGGKRYIMEYEKLGLKRQFLHATSVELVLPSGTRVTFSAELPDDLLRALDLLQSLKEDSRLDN